MATSSNLSRFVLGANRLCIDFANTVEPAGALRAWSDLVDFLEAVEIASPAQADQLRALSANDAGLTGQAFESAKRLRDALREILAASEQRQVAPEEAVRAVNAVLRWTEGYEQLVVGEKGWQLEFVAREQRLEWLLAAIARSAAELIAQGPAAPVRKCSNPNCQLYFYDDSRTRRRRWCSMSVCGNRSKVAAHASRLRQQDRLTRAAGADD